VLGRLDGQILAQRLATDLRRALGNPIVLFRASDAPWARRLQHPQLPERVAAYVTDGPFLHLLASGRLILLWSSFSDQGYAMGIARSRSGSIRGPWVHEPEPIWAADGGHGMIARAHDGTLLLTLHQPNETPLERATFHRLIETAGTVHLADRTGSSLPRARTTATGR
jgi:hypothetical protein